MPSMLPLPLTASADPAAFSPLWAELLHGVEEGCLLLGRYWQQVKTQSLSHRDKADGSPVSEADEAANTLLMALLARLTPDIPVISEESPLPAAGWSAPAFWLLDPLDGTKAFLRGTGEYVISLGLILDGKAVAGIIAAPSWQDAPLIGWGAVGQGAWVRSMNGAASPLKARDVAAQQIMDDGVDLLVAYHGKTPQINDHLTPVRERRRMAHSSALKF